MALVTAQLRQRVFDALDTDLSTSYVVYKSRYFAKNVKDAEAIVDMRVDNDQQLEPDTQGDVRTRTAEFYIRVRRNGLEENIDDDLDADVVAIMAVLAPIDFSDLLEGQEHLEFTSITVADEQDQRGDGVIAAKVIRCDIMYRVDWDDLETPKE